MIENPDTIIKHKPEFCNLCGDDLSHEPATFILRRQFVDIPPIIPKFIEHRIFKKSCPCDIIPKLYFPTELSRLSVTDPIFKLQLRICTLGNS
jgi:transposase